MTDDALPDGALLNALVDICGPDHARAGRSVDTVAGRRVGLVAVPATNRAVAEVLRLAARHGLGVVVRGGGSKIDWGVPRGQVDLLVDTGRLAGMWGHRETSAAGKDGTTASHGSAAPGQTVATAEVATGTRMRALQAALALRGQRVAVDPPSPGATVGGMLAVNESGPLRHRFGAPAEHVERVTYVDLAGNIAESDGEGGRPGLAEIDGVITSAVLRLQPLPPARRWVTVVLPSPLQLPKMSAAADDLAASAIEVDLPADGLAGTLAVLLEGDDESDVMARADLLAGAWVVGAAISATAPPWWGRYPFTRDQVALRLAVSAADLPATLYALGDATGSPVPVRGSAGLGRVHAVLPGTLDADRVRRIMASLEHVLMARGGRAVVIAAPPALAPRLEMAGHRELF